MSPLVLESHALRLLENERVVRAFLDRVARAWEFELSLSGGEILFREPGTGRILFSSPMKLIGTYEHASEQFRFGWGDPAIPEDWKCVTGLGRMRVIARGAGFGVFDSTEPVTLESLAQAQGWAVVCAGFLKAYFVFEAQQDDKTYFLAVDTFPDAGLVERELIRAQQVIQEGTLRFSMNHRQAVESFLGKPSQLTNSNLADETLHWQLGEGELRIRFSYTGQLLQLDAQLPPAEPTALAAVPGPSQESKTSWLARLLGKRR
jgi:hypothetical protein